MGSGGVKYGRQLVQHHSLVHGLANLAEEIGAEGRKEK